MNHECIVKYYDLIETNYSLGINDQNGSNESETDSISSTNTVNSDVTSPSISLSSYSSAGMKDGKIYLVMEWLGDGCNLTNWILKTSETSRNLNCIREILKKLFEAMEYLVKHEIVHHDIKLDNIIYNEENGSVKIIDFGVSELCPNDESYSSFGTPAYQAPEILTRSDPSKPISGHKSDIWSIGVVAYQLAQKEGKLPFEGDSVMQVFDGIINNEPDFSVIKDVQLKDLIMKLLKKDPKERITASEALHHQFVKGEGSNDKHLWKRIVKNFKSIIYNR